MITIYTIPKPFYGHIGIIQENALRSWCELRPRCEIILFGDEEGTAEMASRLNVRHVKEIKTNEYGTPLLNFIFSTAREMAGNRILGYLNSDIILTNDILEAIAKVDKDPFLMIGKRWDLDVEELIDYSSGDWEKKLRERVRKDGVLHPPTGVDYFIFPPGVLENIPPFAVGRPGYDNWFIYHVLSQGIPVIDATSMVMNVHQNHERTYSSIGRENPPGATNFRNGAERDWNIDLMGGRNYSFNIKYADNLLTSKGVKPALSPQHRYYKVKAAVIFNPQLSFLVNFFSLLEFIPVPFRFAWRNAKALLKRLLK